MKKFFLLLIFSILGNCLFAQEEIFGVLRNGLNTSPKEVKEILQYDGYRVKKEDNNSIVLTNDTVLVILSMDDDKNLSSVSFSLPPSTDWENIRDGYYFIKNHLIQNIGSPAYSDEKYGDWNENTKWSVIWKSFEKKKSALSCIFEIEGGHVSVFTGCMSKEEGIYVVFLISKERELKPLEFKGFSVNSTFSDLVKEMESKGFSVYEKTSEEVIFKGNFLGTKDVMVFVNAEENDVVKYLAIAMPCIETWQSVKSFYDSYTLLYTRKYGAPFSEKQRYGMYARSSSQNSYLIYEEVKEGNTEVGSFFRAKDGVISVSIAACASYSKGFYIHIMYKPTIEEEQDSRMNDI